MEKNTIPKKQGVPRSSIEKIYKLIRESNTLLTPSEISKRTNVQFDSVRSALEFLSNFDKIEIITNGKFSFIQLKNPSEVLPNATTN